MKVIKWQPHPEIKNELSVQGFRYESHALVIVFSVNKTIANCRMTFPSPLAFRCTDERYLNVCYNAHDFPGGQFHILRDSAYLAWFRHSSGCGTLSEKVVHYVIFTSDDCFDIISLEPPLVIWEPLDPNPRVVLSPPPWAKNGT